MMQSKGYLLALSLSAGLLTSGGAGVTAAVAQNTCGAAVQAAMTEWQQLSGGRHLAASQIVPTADGRRLRGSAIDWAHVLLGRADSACASGQTDAAMGQLREVQGIFHPATQRM
jgi:hypothetical protein